MARRAGLHDQRPELLPALFFLSFALLVVTASLTRVVIVPAGVRYFLHHSFKRAACKIHYWDGDKNALLAMDGNAIEEYVKFCVSTLRNYFGAIKKNLRRQWDDTDSKLLSVISINGFIIALTRQLSVNGVNDFAFYDRIFNGWTIDFSKDGFKYTSSQYRKFSTQILREVFQISDEIIATI